MSGNTFYTTATFGGAPAELRLVGPYGQVLAAVARGHSARWVIPCDAPWVRVVARTATTRLYLQPLLRSEDGALPHVDAAVAPLPTLVRRVLAIVLALGAAVIVPMLLLGTSMPMLTATGTSLGALLLPVGVAGAWVYYKNGHLDVKAALWIVIVTVFVQALLSWVAPDGPLAGVLNALTFPLLAPVRRLVPPIGGALDLSPLIVIVLAQLILMLPVAWLEQSVAGLLR